MTGDTLKVSRSVILCSSCKNRNKRGADECGEKTQLGSLALVGVSAKLERVEAIELGAVRMARKEKIRWL